MNANPLPPQWSAAQRARQWFVALTDHLPEAYIAARMSDLDALRKDGATPSLAATYARVYLLAPKEV